MHEGTHIDIVYLMQSIDIVYLMQSISNTEKSELCSCA